MLGTEIPLVLFTVLSQTVVGALAALWFLDKKLLTIGEAEFIAAGKTASIFLVIIQAISLFISLFHLGKPMKAYRALAHLSTSWLSREVFFFVVFFVLLIVYMLQWKEDKNAKMRTTLGFITVIVGFLGILSAGMIYILPAMPAWNNLGPIVFFVLTAAVAGPLLSAGVFALRGYSKELNGLIKFSVIAIVIYVVSYFLYISLLGGNAPEAQLTVTQILENGIFWARVVLGWIIPLALLIAVSFNRVSSSKNMIILSFVLIMIGEFMARGLFYSTAVALQIGIL